MGKKSLNRERVLLRLEITVSGKGVKRAMHVFIIWVNFGKK
jgi:hypothetical protein